MHVVTASIELPDDSERHAIPRLQILECEYSSQLSSLSCLVTQQPTLDGLFFGFNKRRLHVHWPSINCAIVERAICDHIRGRSSGREPPVSQRCRRD